MATRGEPILVVGWLWFPGVAQIKIFKICHYCFQLNKSTFTKIEENPEKKNTSEKGRATVIFSLKNEVGGLVKALRLFQVRTNLLHSCFLIY